MKTFLASLLSNTAKLAKIFWFVKETAIVLIAYWKGRSRIKNDLVKQTLKKERKNNAIEEANLLKSDSDILNGLRKRDSRKS